MGRSAAVVVLASLTLVAMVASAGVADTWYQDPRGDYTQPPRRERSPDLIAVQVSNTARSVTFDVNFARSPRRLFRLDVFLDTDVHRALGGGKGRFRQADLTVTGIVSDVYGTGRRGRAYAFLQLLAGRYATGPVGSIRAGGKSVHLTFPSRFVIRDQRGGKHAVVIPRRFRFFVWAWGDPAINVDRDLPDEDFAPNSGWFTYRMT